MPMVRGPSHPPSRPLRRLVVGAVLLCVSAVLFVASVVFQPMTRPLGVAAGVTAIASVGCFIAAAMAAVRNGLLRLSGAFPAGMRRLHIAFAHLVLLGLGLLSMGWAVRAVFSGEAPLRSRRAGTVNVAIDPDTFWASVAFHFLLGLFLFGGGLYAAYRHRKRTA